MVVTLSVPARAESLRVVHAVVMSCGAVSGAGLDEIYEEAHKLDYRFARVLVDEPATRRIELRTPVDVCDVDVSPVRDSANAA